MGWINNFCHVGARAVRGWRTLCLDLKLKHILSYMYVKFGRQKTLVHTWVPWTLKKGGGVAVISMNRLWLPTVNQDWTACRNILDTKLCLYIRLQIYPVASRVYLSEGFNYAEIHRQIWLFLLLTRSLNHMKHVQITQTCVSFSTQFEQQPKKEYFFNMKVFYFIRGPRKILVQPFKLRHFFTTLRETTVINIPKRPKR